MPPAGRKGDIAFCPRDHHEGCDKCPHTVIGAAVRGSKNVRINGRQALRVGDRGLHASCCGSNLWQAAIGSPTVLINNRPAHRMLDITRHCGTQKLGGFGLLVNGSPNVIIGGGYDLKSLATSEALGWASGKLMSPLTGHLATLSQRITNSLHLGPTLAGAVGGMLNGAVAGAVSGALAGGIQNGASGMLAGMRAGFGSGALNGAINGAAAGLWDELFMTPAEEQRLIAAELARLSPEEREARIQEQIARARASGEFESAWNTNFFGSEQHMQFAEYVVFASNGLISVEQAMNMFPAGGIAGPGTFRVFPQGVVGAVDAHAIRHDARGGIYSAFGVGPGYGGLIYSFFGSGHVVGILREILNPRPLPGSPPRG